MIAYFVIFFISYLIGSIPVAFLFTKRTANIDIREKGSGNVGAFNVYAVTQSKSTGIIVGILDGVKGLIAVGFVYLFFEYTIWLTAIALFSAILGHNYPVWLKFKGGRGLATTAGGLFGICLIYTIIWCSTWLFFKRQTKNIITSNLLSCIVTPMITALLPRNWIELSMIAK